MNARRGRAKESKLASDEDAGGEEGDWDANDDWESYERTESNDDDDESDTLRRDEVGEEKDEG